MAEINIAEVSIGKLKGKSLEKPTQPAHEQESTPPVSALPGSPHDPCFIDILAKNEPSLDPPGDRNLSSKLFSPPFGKLHRSGRTAAR
ncbi:hypothetical protein SH139x_000499 [Planctomycetaceae bacterium SH139]